MGCREHPIRRHQHTRAPTEIYFSRAGEQSSNSDSRLRKRISGSKHSPFDRLGGTRDQRQQANQGCKAEKAEITSAEHRRDFEARPVCGSLNLACQGMQEAIDQIAPVVASSLALDAPLGGAQPFTWATIAPSNCDPARSYAAPAARPITATTRPVISFRPSPPRGSGYRAAAPNCWSAAVSTARSCAPSRDSNPRADRVCATR